MKLQQWAHWAEIGASVGVIIALLLLLQEVRGNTLAIERQASLDRGAIWTAPFFPSSDLPHVLAKIKAVDGLERVDQAFVDRYNLTAEESILWTRHLASIWTRLETEYLYDGPSERLASFIQDFLAYPDEQLYWENDQVFFTAEFQSYVESVR